MPERSLRSCDWSVTFLISPGNSAFDRLADLVLAIIVFCHAANSPASGGRLAMQFCARGRSDFSISRNRFALGLVEPVKSDQKPPVLPLVSKSRSANAIPLSGSY